VASNAAKKIVVLLLVVTALVVPLSLALASTGTANSVGMIWLDSQQNDPSGTYSISQADAGHTVYIYWNTVSPPTGTVNVVVTPYDDNDNAQPAIQLGIVAPSASGTTAASFVVPDIPGGYCLVTLYGQFGSRNITIQVASATLLVLPESVFGALAAVVASFAAFGTVKLYLRRRAH